MYRENINKKIKMYLCLNILIIISNIWCSNVFADKLFLSNGGIEEGTLEKINFNSKDLWFRVKSGNSIFYNFEEISSYSAQDVINQEQEKVELTLNDITNIDLLLEKSKFAFRVTSNSVLYYITKDENDPGNSLKADLSGIDLSGIQYINNNLGLEVGAYQGSTDTARTDTYEMPLLDVTNTESISTYGVRTGLLYGLNIRDPGLRLFTGIGVYLERTHQERLHNLNVNELVYGVALKFGLGWAWPNAGIDFWGSFRKGGASGFLNDSAQGGLAVTLYL